METLKLIMALSQKYFKESAWVVFGQIGVVIASFLFIKKLSSSLSVEDYGIIGVALAIVGINYTLLFGPLINSYNRFFSISKKKNQMYIYRKVVNKTWRIAAKILFLVYFFIFLFLMVFNYKEYSLGLILVFIFSIFQSLKNKNVAIIQAARKRKLVGLIQNSELWIRVIFILIVSLFWSNNILIFSIPFFVGIISAFIISEILLKSIFIFNKKEVVNNQKHLQNEMVDFSRPYYFWGAFVSLQQSSDRISLSKFGNLNDTGIYTAIFQIGNSPISMFFGIFNTIVSPIIYEKYNKFDLEDQEFMSLKKFFNQAIIFFTLIILTSSFISYLFSDKIVLFFLDQKYFNFSNFLPLVILSAGLLSLGEFLGLYFSTRNKQNILIKIKIPTSILIVLSNVIFAIYYGVTGVIISVLSFSIIYFLVIYLLFYLDTSKINKR